MVGVAHAAAHQQDGFLIRVNAEAVPPRPRGTAFVEFRVHRNAERQDAVLRNAALYTAVGEQFTRGDDVLHARHILPVRVERVVGNNADGLDIGEFFAFFQLIDHLRCKTCVQMITSGTWFAMTLANLDAPSALMILIMLGAELK